MTFLDGHLGITVFWPLYILQTTLYGHLGWTPGYCAIFSLSIYISDILMWPSWMDTWVSCHFFSQYIPHPYIYGLPGQTPGHCLIFPTVWTPFILLGWTTGYHDIFSTVCTSSAFMWPSGTDNWVLCHFLYCHFLYTPYSNNNYKMKTKILWWWVLEVLHIPLESPWFNL